VKVAEVLELMQKLEGTRWTMYHRGLAEEMAERSITDLEWTNILEEFDYQTEDVWGVLYEAFAEVVNNITNNEEDDE
jgi:hypothetical protein